MECYERYHDLRDDREAIVLPSVTRARGGRAPSRDDERSTRRRHGGQAGVASAGHGIVTSPNAELESSSLSQLSGANHSLLQLPTVPGFRLAGTARSSRRATWLFRTWTLPQGGTGKCPSIVSTFGITFMGVAWKESTTKRFRPSNLRIIAEPLLQGPARCCCWRRPPRGPAHIR